MPDFRVVILAVAVAAAPFTVQAQQHDHQHDVAEMGRLGSVHFPVSCRKEVQTNFNRGVALLHSFWYDEAENTFRRVAEADPQCGMAWWGVAMANYHPIWAAPNAGELERGRAAARKAVQLGAKTDREQAYIDAIAAFFSEGGDHFGRALAFNHAMEKLAERFPGDDEARIFHALTLIERGMASPGDKTYAHQKRAAGILNKLLAKHPAHPGISHYVIHSFDYPALAHLAVDAAHAYAKIAPDSAHALHMPSHIFVRLGLWDETVASNIASARAGMDYVRKNKPGAASWDALHAWDYLAYAYLQKGEDQKVMELLKELPAISALDIDHFAAYYALAAIPVRYALERRNWSEAATLAVNPGLPSWSRNPQAEALISFARAVGAARSGDAARARQDVERLNQLRKILAEQKNVYNWAGQVEIQQRAAEGWIARAEGRDTEAVTLMSAAADLEDATDKHPVTPGSVIPAREMLGELLLEIGRPAEALTAFERSLRDNPNRLNGLTGAARAAQLCGDRVKARDHFIRVARLLNNDQK